MYGQGAMVVTDIGEPFGLTLFGATDEGSTIGDPFGFSPGPRGVPFGDVSQVFPYPKS